MRWVPPETSAVRESARRIPYADGRRIFGRLCFYFAGLSIAGLGLFAARSDQLSGQGARVVREAQAAPLFVLGVFFTVGGLGVIKRCFGLTRSTLGLFGVPLIAALLAISELELEIALGLAGSAAALILIVPLWLGLRGLELSRWCAGVTYGACATGILSLSYTRFQFDGAIPEAEVLAGLSLAAALAACVTSLWLLRSGVTSLLERDKSGA